MSDARQQHLSRRAAFGAIGAAAAAVAAACGESPTSPSSTSAGGTTTSTNANCAVTPTETVGSYPSRNDMFRSDARENRQGTTLTLTVKVVNVNSACVAVAGADVEIWHCDVAGDDSQYGSQAAAMFLRGIQTTNAAGEVTQMAFPESVNNAVHIFSDSLASELVTPVGSPSNGYTATSRSA